MPRPRVASTRPQSPKSDGDGDERCARDDAEDYVAGEDCDDDADQGGADRAPAILVA
jgi:hypothetical protein